MIKVLRLDHRHGRDERVSTHVGLAARAFGADSIFYSGEEDKSLTESINDVPARWGGKFTCEYTKSWKDVIKEAQSEKFKVVHLTIYGMPVTKEIKKIKKHKKLLVVVGGGKVPGEVYQMSDFNVSVTQQPHSEVAALAIFLHEYFQGKELNKKFDKSKIKIVPQKKGKKVLDLN